MPSQIESSGVKSELESLFWDLWLASIDVRLDLKLDADEVALRKWSHCDA